MSAAALTADPASALPTPSWTTFDFAGETAVLATMHGKARAIAPPLRRLLGLEVATLDSIDTDRFGTFTGEVERAGTQLDAARAKVAAAFSASPDARIAIASEGSFGPHPVLPFAPLGRELVLLSDRRTGLEIVGRDASVRTSFSHTVVGDVGAALAFATRVGFPDQGVIVTATVDGTRAPWLYLCKSAATRDALVDAVRRALAAGGAAHLECDMRADRNPIRMAAIRRASVDLVRACRSRCPACERPGFRIRERLGGVPCGWCGAPTEDIRAEARRCDGCGARVETRIGPATTDPGRCGRCNP